MQAERLHPMRHKWMNKSRFWNHLNVWHLLMRQLREQHTNTHSALHQGQPTKQYLYSCCTSSLLCWKQIRHFLQKFSRTMCFYTLVFFITIIDTVQKTQSKTDPAKTHQEGAECHLNEVKVFILKRNCTGVLSTLIGTPDTDVKKHNIHKLLIAVCMISNCKFF